MTTPVPVHLICGFLGSGKTTLLRRILSEQPENERLVVLVNEFGELGIDGQFLDGFESEVMELTSGCICCTLKADFVTSLTQILKDFKPQRVIVEATGLAETGDLSEAVSQVAQRTDVTLASVATVVDADMFSYREMLGPLYFNQIRHADLVLLNKTDLIELGSVDELTRDLMELNPDARVLPTVHCAVERDLILAPVNRPGLEGMGKGFSGTLQIDLPDLTKVPVPESHQDQKHSKDFLAFNFQKPGVMDPQCFERFLKELPWEVFRVKGFVRFPDGMQMVNYTYRRPEYEPVEESGLNRLAFVAWKIDAQTILAGLEECLFD